MFLENVEQQTPFSEFGGKHKQAASEKHDDKRVKKTTIQAKKSSKVDKKTSKNSLRDSKGTSKVTKANAKGTKAQAKQTKAENTDPTATDDSSAGGILKNVMGMAGSLFGKSPATNVEGLSDENNTGSPDDTGGNNGGSEGDPFYKQTWFFITAGVTVVGGILAFVFLGKKKK